MVLGELQNVDPTSLLHQVETLLDEAREALEVDADLGEIESRIKSLALQADNVTYADDRSNLKVSKFFNNFFNTGGS